MAEICSQCGKAAAGKMTASKEKAVTETGKAVTETGKRLPRSWKRHTEKVFCGVCWAKSFVLRAIIFPVVEPLDATWEELNAALKLMFRETTRASNWMVVELAKGDIKREPNTVKMPPMPRLYLYPEARQQFPSLPSQTVASLEQAIQAKYRAKRYEVVWTCTTALPTYKYPQPFPVHNQSWTPAIVNDRPQVNVRIADRRYILRLKGGMRYRRQLSAFRLMCIQEAVCGELALYRMGKDLLCKMVAWLPRKERMTKTGTLFVKTAADALVVAVNGKDEKLWRYNAEQVKGWVAEHKRLLQCWAEDSKFEHRPVPAFAERRQAASHKYHNRLKSLAYTTAALIAGYARRRRFMTVQYDDRERGYCPDFVWFEFRQRIQVLLDEYGIEFVAVVGDNESIETATGTGTKTTATLEPPVLESKD